MLLSAYFCGVDGGNFGGVKAGGGIWLVKEYGDMERRQLLVVRVVRGVWFIEDSVYDLLSSLAGSWPSRFAGDLLCSLLHVSH